MEDKMFQRCSFPRLNDGGALHWGEDRNPEGFERIFKRIESCTRAVSEHSGGLNDEAPGNRLKGADIEELERRAYAQGFSEGEKAGIETGMKKVAPVLKNFEQAKEELEKVRGQIYSRVERETVELALAIARKIVFQEVRTDREVILRVVREALKRTNEAANVKIRINPSDFNILKNNENMFGAEMNSLENLHLIKDDRINDGGCMIETEMGEIDARIETQLRAVEDEFRNELKLMDTGI